MSQATNGGAPTQVVVLVVDDDPNIRLLVGDLLARPERDIQFAPSGADALRVLRRTTPAVVLLDVQLGDMTGFELARLMRANVRLSTTPVVFITGHATDDDAMSEGYDLGAVDYLSKPVIPQILESKVNALCTLALQVKEIERQRDCLETMQQELTRANETLEKLAATDPLTGLLNRRQFLLSLDRERAHQIRSERNHVLAMFDLDGFKGVNDTYGHAAGDQLLIGVAQRLARVIRPYDLASRLGGDEFCLLIQETADLAGAAAIGQRLKDALEDPYELSDSLTVSLHASIGVIQVTPTTGADSDEILRLADQAMYRPKRRGGAAVAVGSSAESQPT